MKPQSVWQGEKLPRRAIQSARRPDHVRQRDCVIAIIMLQQ